MTCKLTKRAILLAGSVALCLQLGAGSVLAAEFTMKFGTATINEDQHQFIKFFKEELEGATDGRIEVEIYPQSQLGTIQRMIEGLQLGTIEGFIGPADFYVGIEPRFGIFSTPTLFRDRLHAAATVADPELNEAVRNLAGDRGLVGIGVYSMAQHDYLGRRPLLTLDDFNGKKIRVNATEMERTAMAKLGASAAPMSLGEVLPSLQRGVIDATRSALSIFVTLNYNDVAEVVTVTNDTMLIPVATVSKAWLDRLPEDLQEEVIAAGQRVQERTQEWANTFHTEMPKRWEERGGRIHHLSAEEHEQFIALLRPVGDEVTRDNPPLHEMLILVRETAAKY
jgi:TRAP-type transport system periplasmic protein